MDQISSLIEYFQNLIDDLYSQHLLLNGKVDITSFIYQYMLDDNKDFSELDENYFNCDEYSNLDRKECLKNLMFAIYIMMKFYNNEQEDLYENVLLEDVDEVQIQNNLDDLFEIEDFGIDIVDKFLLYLDFSSSRKKKMALNLVNNKNFNDSFPNNNYIKMILVSDINLEIPEIAMLVSDISDIYEVVSIDKNFYVKDYKSIIEATNDIQTDYENLEKVRKKLVFNSLKNKYNLDLSKGIMKHWFSIMVKSVYINIYTKKQNSTGILTKLDDQFFDLINKNEQTFEDLFYKFMHDTEFSTYLLGVFYFDNVDKDLIDYEKDEAIYQNQNLEEKIKKYYR